ncbi:unnamed protein product [Euphydryas editha]|uniref:Interferon-related developmental regulator N-terminal domain-containing protein n=1 Tax=Euphydryas editha TaxID=104508 RepID=A0AAU9VFC4_EUPED|nr:unnamed protein product [Euphydryas editha]
MNINNIAENQRTEKISSLTSSDDELSGDDNDEHDADIATFNVGMNDINDTVPKYTKYYEEIHGRDDDNEDEQLRNEANVIFEEDPYARLLQDVNSVVNADIRNATLSKLGAIAKKKEKIQWILNNSTT